MPGALDPADAGQAVAAVKQQGVDQRAAGAAGGRVDHHADRLVDDDQLVVLVEDVERDVLGLGIWVLGRRRSEQQSVARLDLGLGLDARFAH